MSYKFHELLLLIPTKPEKKHELSAKGLYVTHNMVIFGEKSMCEFNVIIGGKTQFKDVVYAVVKGNNVTVKNVLGEVKEFKNCTITEVDVNSTRLVLTSTKA